MRKIDSDISFDIKFTSNRLKYNQDLCYQVLVLERNILLKLTLHLLTLIHLHMYRIMYFFQNLFKDAILYEKFHDHILALFLIP